MPSGRDIYTPKPYGAPTLEVDILARMRAPLDKEELAKQERESDEDSDTNDGGRGDVPGAFPATSMTNDSPYY